MSISIAGMIMAPVHRLLDALSSNRLVKGTVVALLALCFGTPAFAGGEADLVIPPLEGHFLGMTGHQLLLIGLGICVLGIVFGLVQYGQIRDLPVHKSMLEISELIYETCKTYLITQIKFIALLWGFIAIIMLWYFKFMSHMGWNQVLVILFFRSRSLIQPLGFIGWPLEFGHTFGYFGAPLIEAAALTQVSDPQAWFALNACYALAVWGLYAWDLRVVQRQAREVLAHGHHHRRASGHRWSTARRGCGRRDRTMGRAPLPVDRRRR